MTQSGVYVPRVGDLLYVKINQTEASTGVCTVHDVVLKLATLLPNNKTYTLRYFTSKNPVPQNLVDALFNAKTDLNGKVDPVGAVLPVLKKALYEYRRIHARDPGF